jgi:hypothetical protein
VLIGAAISVLSYPITKGFADGVRGAQLNGTLEAMLMTCTRPTAVILSSGAYTVMMALLEAILALVIGTLFLEPG